MLNNKHLLVTGGTGSFGMAVVDRLIKRYPKIKITIFSRDEKKQDDMRELYSEANISYFIGDVRDINSLINAMSSGVEYVFHAAALKQVPSCEFHPIEAIKTNIIGTDNLISAAIQLSIKNVICLSTDKAVYPVNAMGMSKGMMEKVALAHARKTTKTKICITRYGNVVGTRGSVIPKFIKQLKDSGYLTITDERMTRFVMTLADAVDLVLYAFESGENGDTFIMKSPAANIIDVANAVAKIVGMDKFQKKIIGFRHGEKMHESLLSDEEMGHAIDLGEFLKVPLDIRGLKYSEILDRGNIEINKQNPYDSNNAIQLNVSQIIDIINKSGIL